MALICLTNRNKYKQLETNIPQKTEPKNMHSHNVRIKNFKKYYKLTQEEAISAIELLDEYLPHGYSEDIVAMAFQNKINITSQSVRSIKGGHYKNTTVFNYILNFAAEKKANEIAAHNSFKKILSA